MSERALVMNVRSGPQLPQLMPPKQTHAQTHKLSKPNQLKQGVIQRHSDWVYVQDSPTRGMFTYVPIMHDNVAAGSVMLRAVWATGADLMSSQSHARGELMSSYSLNPCARCAAHSPRHPQAQPSQPMFAQMKYLSMCVHYTKHGGRFKPTPTPSRQ
jgi:hypothetical protein